MDWETTLIRVGIEKKSAKDYAKLLDDNGINNDNIDMLNRELLKEIGITIMGHQISILKLGKKNESPSHQATASVASARAPRLRTEMTEQQFRKFKIDWQCFLDIKG